MRLSVRFPQPPCARGSEPRRSRQQQHAHLVLCRTVKTYSVDHGTLPVLVHHPADQRLQHRAGEKTAHIDHRGGNARKMGWIHLLGASPRKGEARRGDAHQGKQGMGDRGGKTKIGQPNQPDQGMQVGGDEHDRFAVTQAVREGADEHGTNGKGGKVDRQVRGGCGAAHAVDLGEVGHGPQAAEGKKASGDAHVDHGAGPGGGVGQHGSKPRECAGAIHARSRVGGGVLLCRVIAHQEPAPCAQQQRHHPHAHEYAAPAKALRGEGQRRASQHRAQVADQHADADQGGEAVRLKPDGDQFEHGDEGHGDPQTDEGAASQGHVQVGGHPEEQTAGTPDQTPQQQNAAWSQGIDQHARGYLHDQIDVEVGGSQQAQRRAGGVKRLFKFLGDAHRRKALKKGDHIGGGDDAERPPAAPLLCG